MKYTTKKHSLFTIFLLLIIFMIAACTYPNYYTTTPSATTEKIVWTDTNNVKHYANVPTDGVLLWSTLTGAKTNIKSVDIIPSSVTRIESSTFEDCSGLESITIPNSVTSIGIQAFSSCRGLTSATIPSSVTSIESSAFNGCIGLTSITIPSSVTSIGEFAFAYCSALTSVRVEATTPPTAGGGMFDNTHANLSITVPTASVDAYKAAGGWSAYANQITGY